MNFHRPIVMGTRGMVATGHPLASDAALDVLKAGGNAFDAALCASAVLSVIKSYHCGLGGDLFGVFYSAGEGKTLVLNGSGKAPRKIHRDMFSDSVPHRGILAASTPGTVDGWLEVATRLGTRRIDDLLEPAIHYAENGFPVFPHLANATHAHEKTLGANPAWSKIFLKAGKAPKVGELFVQKDLADSLRAIAAGGREAFYGGGIARSIIRTSERYSGCFSLDDFAEHRSRWEQPISTVYRGYEICVPPPNSFGLLLLLQLKRLAEHDVARLGHNTPECVALQVEAHAEAWRAGQYWIADPDQHQKREVHEFLQKYSVDQTTYDSAGEVLQGSSTTYIAVADRVGNWASLIQSVHQSFGCGVVVDGTGIVLNNRMSGFNFIAGHPNELAADKRPAHTLAPALVLRNKKPFAAIGTPGGLGQTQFLTQTLCNFLDFKMNIQEAIEAPRWQSEKARHVELESRLGEDVSRLLLSLGYDVKMGGAWEFSFGGVEAVLLHSNERVFLGAADPRREGYALGY